MKKSTLIILPLLTFFITGCGLLKFGRRTRSSSESSETASSEKDSSSGHGTSHGGNSSSSTSYSSSSSSSSSQGARYYVSYYSSYEYTITGLQSSYYAGDVVSFGVTVNVSSKVLDYVTANGTTLQVSPNGYYYFYMPEGDVYLDVYLKDKDVSGTFNFEQIDYTLKPGVSRSELEGAPWINSNLEGMLEKIEKPSCKDDFYASINYEDILNGTPGYLDISYSNVSGVMNQIFDSSSGAHNSTFLNRVWNLSINGSASEINYYFNNFDFDSFVNSKDLFSSGHSFFQITKENNVYYVTYTDGYCYGPANIAFLSLAGLDSAKMYINYYVYDAFGLPYTVFNSTYSDYDDNYKDMNTFDSEVAYASYSTYMDYGDDWRSYYMGGHTGVKGWLDNALADYGITNSDTVKIAFPSLAAINTMDNYDPSIMEMALITRLAFSYRALSGVENYRMISPLCAATGWFPDVDISSADDSTAAMYASRVAFSDLVESSYIKAAANDSIRSQITGVIEQVISKYKEMSMTYDWLDNAGKNSVYNKLDYMRYYSCFSDKIRNYPDISTSSLYSSSLFELYLLYLEWINNLKVSGSYEYDQNWYMMTSYTVNAFYMPNRNIFVILNGILSGCPLDGSIEQVLASMGMVIGHEISHSIDSSGSLYDEYGHYNENWLSTYSKNNFNNKVNKMIDFYNNINAFGTTMVDGDVCDGEATADMGGLHVCLEIAKSYPNFDYDLFFRTYAKLWLTGTSNMTYMEARVEDSHPLNYLRVNVTVAQFEEFYQTYDIQPGDRMYIPEDERVAIW